MVQCSPQLAAGSGSVLAYAEEGCFGYNPQVPTLKVCRRRSTSLGLAKEAYTSEEIRSDRMISSSRHGIRRVEGDVVTEISPNSHADFYEALLGGAWERPTATLSVVDATYLNVMDSDGLIRVTGVTPLDPNTLGYVRGDIITFADTTFTALDGKLFQIVGMNITTGQLRLRPLVVPLSGTEPTDPFTAGTVSLKGGRVRMGNIYRSFTFERAFADIGSYLVMNGVRVNSAQVELPPSGIATCTFGMMGKDAKPLSATSIDGTAALVTTDTAHGILTFDKANNTITAASGSFVSDGFAAGNKVELVYGSGGVSYTKTLTLLNVAARVLTVAEAAPDAASTGNWTMTRLSAPDYADASTNDVLVAASGTLMWNAIPVGTVTALSINVDNQMAGSPVVGANVIPATLWGNQAAVGGSMTVLFDRGGVGEQVYNAFTNETDLMSLMMTLTTADGLNCVSFVLNRVKINSGDIGDAVAEGLPVTADFVALKPQSSNSSTSAIIIYDTTIPTGKTSPPSLPLIVNADFSDAIAGSPDGFAPAIDDGFGTDPV